MKIILSRKGFDSSYGGTPSPILPDGTLLSMPIPDDSLESLPTYNDIHFDGLSYAEMLHDLPRRKKLDFDGKQCHVDPDIREGVRTYPVKDWKPAFGQTDNAQGMLRNAGISEGDLFLFFGWFRKTETRDDGSFRYTGVAQDDQDFYDHADLHIVYGYMQIGRIITDPNEIKKYYWHPHATQEHISQRNNALYIPSDHLSFDKNKPGYGVLNYDISRVLTMNGKTKATWNEYDFLMPDKIVGQSRKNSAENGGLFYKGEWQEIVFKGTDEIINWAKKIIVG